MLRQRDEYIEKRPRGISSEYINIKKFFSVSWKL